MLGVDTVGNSNKVLGDEMECSKCGAAAWTDDDLHWTWCDNAACEKSWARRWEHGFGEALDQKERAQREKDAENLNGADFAARHGSYWARQYNLE